MTTIKFKNGDNWENMALSCYPVGSVYMSENSTSPATIFGGTWVALENRMLIGASGTYSAGSTGGSATTTLVTTNLPAHAHTVPEHGHGFTQPTVNGGATTTGGGGGHGHDIIRANDTSKRYYRTEMETTGYCFGTSGGFINRGVVEKGASAITTNQTNNRLYAANVGNHTHSQVAHTHSVSGGAVKNQAAFNTQNTGSGTAFNTISPYYAVYMWKRTA